MTSLLGRLNANHLSGSGEVRGAGSRRSGNGTHRRSGTGEDRRRGDALASAGDVANEQGSHLYIQ